MGVDVRTHMCVYVCTGVVYTCIYIPITLHIYSGGMSPGAGRACPRAPAAQEALTYAREAAAHETRVEGGGARTGLVTCVS